MNSSERCELFRFSVSIVKFKHICQYLMIKKVSQLILLSELICNQMSCSVANETLSQMQTPRQVISCEICVIFKNTYFVEHLRTAASGLPVTLLTWGSLKF